MTVVGTAEIVAVMNTSNVEGELAKGTAPGFSKVEKDAEKSGEKAGKSLGGGMSKGLGAVKSILGTLGVPIGAFGDSLDKAGEKVKGVDTKTGGFLNTVSGIGKGLLIGGAAGVIAFGAASVDASMKYSSATTTIAANAGISVKAATNITNAFLDSAGKTIYSAQQQAVAYAGVAGELGATEGKALNAAQANKVMTASMDLAEGASISLQSAAKDTADVMQAYHLSVGQASAATDVLFSTARVTGLGVDAVTGSVDKLKAKLGDAAPSLGQVGGLLDVLAKNGVSGTVAMRAMNSGFNTLLGGGKAVTDMAKTLGLQIYDSRGKFVGLQSVVAQLQPKLAGLTQEQQLAATKAIFGAGANKQLLDVILSGPAAYAKATAAVQQSGAAHAAAEKQAQTLAHQFDLVKAAIEDLAVKFGNVLVPKIKDVIGAISSSVTWLEKHKSVAEALAIAIGVGLVTAIGVFVGTTIAEMSLLDAALGGLPLIIGGLTVAIALVATHWHQVWTDMTNWFHDAETYIAAGLVLLGGPIGALIAVAMELATHWSSVWDGIKIATQDSVNFVIRIIDDFINVAKKVSIFGWHPAGGLKDIATINITSSGSSGTGPAGAGVLAPGAESGLGLLGGKSTTAAKSAGLKNAEQSLEKAGNSITSTNTSKLAPAASGLGGAVDALGAGGKAAASAANKAQSAADKAAKTQETEAKKAAAAIVAAHKKALAEIAKEDSSDRKKGMSELNKLLNATHSGSLKTLNTVLSANHVEGLKHIEADLTKAHTAGLTELNKKIESAYKAALTAQTKAQAAALALQTQQMRDQQAQALGLQTQGQTDAANAAATAIADQTKVTLDQQAEQGLTGADLVAAQAQTALDTLTMNNDAAIATATQNADNAAGGDALTQAQAAAALASAQGNAATSQAQGQANVDLTGAAATIADNAAAAAASAASAPSTTSSTSTSAPTSTTGSASSSTAGTASAVYEPGAVVVTIAQGAFQVNILPGVGADAAQAATDGVQTGFTALIQELRAGLAPLRS